MVGVVLRGSLTICVAAIGCLSISKARVRGRLDHLVANYDAAEQQTLENASLCLPTLSVPALVPTVARRRSLRDDVARMDEDERRPLLAAGWHRRGGPS